MPLPAPNLDDRRFQDLVDDAKRLVQRRCPEWTDHNVSDPGITLIETFAYLVDQVLYRLNRVPERSYVTFLELMGVELFPPVGGDRPGDVLADRAARGGPRRRGRHRGRHPAAPHERGDRVPHDRRPRHPPLPAHVRDDGRRRRAAVRPVERARQRAAGRRVLRRAAGRRHAVRRPRPRRRRAARWRSTSTATRRATASTRPIRRGCGRRSAPTAGCAATSRTAPAASTRPATSSSTSRRRTPRRCSRSAPAAGCAAGSSPPSARTRRRTRTARCCNAVDATRSAARRPPCTARTSSTSWSASPRACPASASRCCGGRSSRPSARCSSRSPGQDGWEPWQQVQSFGESGERRPALAAQRQRRHDRVRPGRAPGRRHAQAVRRDPAGRRPRPRPPLPHRRRPRRQRRRPRDRHAEVGACRSSAASTTAGRRPAASTARRSRRPRPAARSCSAPATAP